MSSSLVQTGVSDSVSGKAIVVTSSARKTLRQSNPDWKHIKNEDLSKAIAIMFSGSPEIGKFTPKKQEPGSTGHVRGSESSKFIAVEKNQGIFVIAAKGSHKLQSPPQQNKKASRDDALRAHRGWLEEHYFDMFIGQYALDSRSAALMRTWAGENGGIRKLKKMPQDQISLLARELLAEDQRGQITRDPGLPQDKPGLLNTPVGFPPLSDSY